MERRWDPLGGAPLQGISGSLQTLAHKTPPPPRAGSPGSVRWWPAFSVFILGQGPGAGARHTSGNSVEGIWKGLDRQRQCVLGESSGYCLA